MLGAKNATQDWYRIGFFTKYVRWGWHKKPLFTESANCGWYKKVPLSTCNSIN